MANVPNTNKLITVNVARRPWYEWLLWAGWFVLAAFMAQNALASSAELEPRAAAIFWMSFVVLLVAGAIVWFVRRARLSR
jgi:heme/copper-type cytochrome/quinol oxidase subunit 2